MNYFELKRLSLFAHHVLFYFHCLSYGYLMQISQRFFLRWRITTIIHRFAMNISILSIPCITCV